MNSGKNTLRRARRVGALAGIGWAICLPATAGESPLVVTATRVEQSSFDLPVSIDVVAPEQMQGGLPMVNAAESLARVPGIVAPNQYRFSSDQQVSSRGFGARSGFGVRGIRLYADGIPQTMPDGQGQLSSFNLASAARMEVMRGPFSALYGNSSGGVIQIFTADGPPKPHVVASAQAGSFDTWRTGIQAGGQAGAFNYLIDAARYQTDGYREHSEARRNHLNAKLTWRAGDQTRARLVVNSLDQPYNRDPLGLTRAQLEANPQQAGSGAISANTGGSKSQDQVGLQFEHRVDERNTIQASGWLGERNSYTVLAIPFNAAPVVRGSGGISVIDRAFGGVDLRWRHRIDTASGPLAVSAGINYERMKDVRTGFENNAGAQGVLRRDEDNLVWNFDQYLQAEWQLGKDWIVSGGLRHTDVRFSNRDRYVRGANPDDSGNAAYARTNPVFGVVYHLTPTVNVYANAGRGFETPSFIELAYRNGGVSGLNFDLQPALSRNFEAGLKAFVGTGTRVNLALFKTTTRNEIVVDTNAFGRATYKNAGRTARRGVEIAVDSEPLPNLAIHLAYALLDARFQEGFSSGTGGTVAAGNRLPGTPRTTFYGEVAWKHPESGFSTAFEARYASKIYVDDINSDAAPAAAIFNWRAAFTQKIGGVRLQETLRIENLGDRRSIGGVLVNDGNSRFFAPAPGRNFLLGVSLDFAF